MVARAGALLGPSGTASRKLSDRCGKLALNATRAGGGVQAGAPQDLGQFMTKPVDKATGPLSSLIVGAELLDAGAWGHV